MKWKYNDGKIMFLKFLKFFLYFYILCLKQVKMDSILNGCHEEWFVEDESVERSEFDDVERSR